MTVKIYNAAGMTAATLPGRAVPGDYNYIYLDLSRFAPGVYYYLLTGKKDLGGSEFRRKEVYGSQMRIIPHKPDPGVLTPVFTAVLAALVYFAGTASYAAVNPGAGIIFPELDSGAGARAAAMGGAFTAVADDAGAAYWNPAGLAVLEKSQVMITFDKWFSDSFYQHFIAALPIQAGAIAVDIFYMSYGTFETIDDSGNILGATMNPYAAAGTLSYGVGLGPNLSLGAGFTYAAQSIADITDSGFGINIGALYKWDIYSAGLSAKNIGSGGGFSMPADLRAGLAANIINDRSNSLLVSMDASYIANYTPGLCLGAEYSFMKTFSIRAGYAAQFKDQGPGTLNGFAGGVGFKAGDLFLDYTVEPFNELGLIQKVSMNFEFDRIKFGSGAVVENTGNGNKPAVDTKAELHELFEQAGMLENSGKLDQAREKYLDIIAIDVNYAEAWKRLGAVYVKQGKRLML